MLDLRRKVIAVKVKPSESKEQDFHLALADYLYKELKYQGVNISRRSINLTIKLESKHQNKYDHIVIDCLEGKLYLRGQEVKDKFFGKLRRFEGSKPADAYHCVVQSATRIINRINRLINDALDENDEREIYAENVEIIDLRKKFIKDLRNKTASVVRKDLRKKSVIKDLRKTASIKPKDLRKTASIKDLMKLAYTDVSSDTDIHDRESAVCYIDGEICEGLTHAECINNYFQEHNLGELRNKWSRPDLNRNYDDIQLIKKNIQKLAFAHLINEGEIRVETDSLYNVSEGEVASALKVKYPGAVIYDDNKYDEIRDRYKKIAKDLRKKIVSVKDMRKKKLNKFANLQTLKDVYPDIENYDFVNIGIKNINVNDIIGLSDSRIDDYNDDFTPKNSNDLRWTKIYNGYKNGENVPPIPLIETPDGKYFPDGDGNHRISAAKVLGLSNVEAEVFKMVHKNQGVAESWEEYAKEKIDELNSMSTKYQSMWPKFYELQDVAFESGNKKEYNEFKKEMDNLSKQINKLNQELIQEEKEYKQNLINKAAKLEVLKMKRLIKKSEVQNNIDNDIIVIEVDADELKECDNDEKSIYQKWNEFSSKFLNILNKV